jgi:hypothetical protein
LGDGRAYDRRVARILVIGGSVDTLPLRSEGFCVEALDRYPLLLSPFEIRGRRTRPACNARDG